MPAIIQPIKIRASASSSSSLTISSTPNPPPRLTSRVSASSTTATTTTMPTPRPLRAVVVGGGPGGLATAICLANSKGPRPWIIDVFEKRPLSDVTDGKDERRTYGLVCGAARALSPLVAAGVDARKVVTSRRLLATAVFPGVAPATSPPSSSSPTSEGTFSLPKKTIIPLVPGYNYAGSEKSPSDSGDGGDGDDVDLDDPTKPGALFMIDRAFLVRSLAEFAEQAGEKGGPSSSVSLHWGAPLASLDPERRVVRFFEEKNGSEEEERSYDLLVACDGGGSAARLALEEAGHLTITELPSPVSLTDYKTFHGLDDAGAEHLGLDTSGKGTTFALFSAPPPPPPPPGSKEPATYPGSMAVHRRPGKGNRGWSGLLSQPPGVYESLRGSPPEAYASVLDGILGVQDPEKPWFPPSWRREILGQLAAEPSAGGGGGGGDIGRLARLFRASTLAVPAAGIALVGDAATTNTPQLGQGAASAIEDAAVLADSVTTALLEMEREKKGTEKKENDEGDDSSIVSLALSRGLEEYDAKRRRARYALQDMERELAVTNRPAPPAGQEPVEDTEARAAWRAFFDEGKKRAARRAAARKLVGRLLPFSRRARRWADGSDASELGWWNREIHSSKPFDEIYATVRGKGAGGKSGGSASAAAAATAVVAGLAAAALIAVRRVVAKA